MIEKIIELNKEREIIKKTRNEKANNRRNWSKSLIKYIIALFFINLKHVNIMDLIKYDYKHSIH